MGDPPFGRGILYPLFWTPLRHILYYLDGGRLMALTFRDWDWLRGVSRDMEVLLGVVPPSSSILLDLSCLWVGLIWLSMRFQGVV